MNMYLPGMENEWRDHSLSQWFTPAWLAQRMANWAIGGRRGLRVLEPSAGNGSLVSALFAAGAKDVTAVEIDERHLYQLARANGGQPFDVKRWDFFALTPADLGQYDLSVMNPAYEDGKDVRFVEHALEFCPRVVGVFRTVIVHSEERRAFWKWHDIIRGKWLANRPVFGRGEKANQAMSDFVVLEIRKRVRAREPDEDMALSFGWW